MCGIAGIARFDGGALAAVGRARAMRKRLAHRGPDGEGELLSSHAILQHTRLALLDRAGGQQPMTTPDGRYSIVFNGEIYDHDLLRRELTYDFRTRSDAETVLAAFVRWGPTCVRRFNGMFAFFVWDNVEQRGFAARDPLGVKPFAYAWDGTEFLFASEANVVARALRSKPTVDREALLEYWVAPYFSGVERSAFAGVELLQPGHTLTVTRAGLQRERYFHFVPSSGESAPHPDDLRAALERAVHRAAVADEPIGVFLSGGLDSSALAALAMRGRAPLTRAFTIAFESMSAFDYALSKIVISDDQPFAILAAESARIPLTRVEPPRADLADDLQRVAASNDAFPAWEQEIAQDRLARAAARELKAVFVGDAADETHFGYHFLLDETATASPRGILERFGMAPIRRDVLADPLGHFTEKYRAWMPETTDQLARIAGVTSLIVERWLPRLLHNGDIHTMRYGLEARVPFADVELLALAMQVAPAVGLAGGVEKALLREALRDVIPEPIRTRRKSALPKDQACAAIYQRECARLLAEAPSFVSETIDVARVRPWLDPSCELAEWQRAVLFRIIGACHFGRHHGIT